MNLTKNRSRLLRWVALGLLLALLAGTAVYLGSYYHAAEDALALLSHPAEGITVEELPGERLLFRRADDDPLAGGETVRLNDESSVVVRGDKFRRFARVVEDGAARGRDVRAIQNLFAEHLAALDLRRDLARSERAKTFGGKRVDETRRQRLFRTDDRKIDSVLLRESN